MTTLERTGGRVNIAPMVVALAIALSLAMGIVIGGPLLHLTLQRAPWSPSQQLRDAGRQWELEHTQQTPRHSTLSGIDASTLTGGQAWEAQRQQVTPRHR